MLLCLVVCLTFLASSFLPSHLSLSHVHSETRYDAEKDLKRRRKEKEKKIEKFEESAKKRKKKQSK